MGNEEILHTDILRARIAELEYSKKGIISEEQIRRIYIEETSQKPPGEITVYHSNDIEELNALKKAGKDSGFDGTVIHFYDPKQGINQSYTITRGSESSEDAGKGGPLDWAYNVLGIFTGQVQNQYNAAEDFDEIITQKINEKVDNDIEKRHSRGEVIQNISLDKYGIGHSLGGNHIQMLELTTQSFKSVYAINDAAPTSYQLAFLDTDFRFLLSKKFNIPPDSDTELYSIPPDQLKAFAEQYYKEKGNDIHHLTAEEDMLYGALSVRGFLDLGERKVIDTNADYNGIGKMIANLSDKDLQKLQLFLTELTSYYQEGGMEGLIGGLTGIDNELFELIDTVENEWEKFFKEGPEWTTIDMYLPVSGYPPQQQVVDLPVPTLPPDLLITHQKLGQKIGNIKEKLAKLSEQMPVLISLIEAASIAMKNEIISYLKEIKGHIGQIVTSIGLLAVVVNDLVTIETLNIAENVRDFRNAIVGIRNADATFRTEIVNIIEKIKKIINTPKEFGHAIEAHGVTHVASALGSLDGKRYEGNDMVRFKVIDGGKKVEVNLSSAVRIYRIGMEKSQEKADVLNKMREAYYREYVDDFQDRRSKLADSIVDMEFNPHAYRYLLPSRNVEMRRINVHEDIQPLNPIFHESFESAFHFFQEEQRKGIELIKQIRASIEEMFQEDQKISAIFDLR